MPFSILPSLRARVRRVRPPAYYREAQSYWERRHRLHGASLRGVGSIGLDHEANQRDYDAKWSHIRPVLEAAKDAGATTLLDAGCGIGHFSQLAHGLGYDVTGVDFSANAVEIAAKAAQPGLRFRVAQLSKLPRVPSFGVVLCVDVLFHVIDDTAWGETVAALSEAVEAGGRLVIQEHLVAEREAVIPDGRRHTRWRTVDDYREVLSGWQLAEHVRYDVPAEQNVKDLMVWIRS
jgi:SAM-dependent methyltransferase